MSRRRLTDAERAERRAATWTDAAYTHFDPADGGYGSRAQWQAAAEQLADGRGVFTGPTASAGDPDLRLLGLDGMPADAQAVVKAFRRMAKVLHPDQGGNAEDFKAMFAAYERLISRYSTRGS